MTDFVRDDTDLPGPKVQWDGASDEATEPDQWMDSADYNAMRSALNDVRGWIKPGLTPGTHDPASVTVDADGQITAIGNAAGGVPTSRTITAGTGLTGGGDLSANRTLAIANTAVAPGTYTLTTLTVDQQGRIVAASNGVSGSFQTDCGDGSDGVATMDGTTAVTGCTLTNPGAAGIYTQDQRSLFYSSLVLNVGITFKQQGFPTRVQTTPTINGIVSCDGGDAIAGFFTQPAYGGSPYLAPCPGVGNASNQAPQVFPISTASNAAPAPLGGGTPGANGTNGTKGRGGGGGAGGNNANTFTGTGSSGNDSPSVSSNAVASDGDFRQTVYATSGRNRAQTVFTLGTGGGSGGAGGAGGAGGGVGAMGGHLVWCSPGLSGAGTIRARGGAGLNGQGIAGLDAGGSGGGGGGAGGLLVLCMQGQSTGSVTIDVSGGPGGTGAAGNGGGGNGGGGGHGGAGHVSLQ